MLLNGMSMGSIVQILSFECCGFDFGIGRSSSEFAYTKRFFARNGRMCFILRRNESFKGMAIHRFDMNFKRNRLHAFVLLVKIKGKVK